MTRPEASDESGADPFESDDLVGEYDVRSPLTRTILTVVGTVIALAVAAGVAVGVSFASTSERTEATTIDTTELSSLRIAAGVADVRVRPTTGSTLEVSAEISEGLLDTDYAVRRSDDGEIVISSSCRPWLVPGCGVEVELGVPEGLPLEVRTTSGSIELDAVGGVVVARSGSGDIAATDLTAVDLDLLTTSGDIEAAFATQPAGVKARTSSGDVALDLPAGETRYAVRADTDSGTVESDVEDDPAGTGFVTVETASGDIDLSTVG